MASGKTIQAAGKEYEVEKRSKKHGEIAYNFMILFFF